MQSFDDWLAVSAAALKALLGPKTVNLPFDVEHGIEPFGLPSVGACEVGRCTGLKDIARWPEKGCNPNSLNLELSVLRVLRVYGPKVGQISVGRYKARILAGTVAARRTFRAPR